MIVLQDLQTAVPERCVWKEFFREISRQKLEPEQRGEERRNEKESREGFGTRLLLYNIFLFVRVKQATMSPPKSGKREVDLRFSFAQRRQGCERVNCRV